MGGANSWIFRDAADEKLFFYLQLNETIKSQLQYLFGIVTYRYLFVCCISRNPRVFATMLFFSEQEHRFSFSLLYKYMFRNVPVEPHKIGQEKLVKDEDIR